MDTLFTAGASGMVDNGAGSSGLFGKRREEVQFAHMGGKMLAGKAEFFHLGLARGVSQEFNISQIGDAETGIAGGGDGGDFVRIGFQQTADSGIDGGRVFTGDEEMQGIGISASGAVAVHSLDAVDDV